MAGLAALTGVTGFLGGYVAEALAARGWRLRVLLRRWWEPPDALRETSVETVLGDLSDTQALTRLVAGADAVIHMAGVVRSPDAARIRLVNAEGAGHLGDAVRRTSPDARLVLVSSMAAREPQLSVYAGSKRSGEDRTTARYPEAVILRPSAIYGPGDRETLSVFRLMNSPVQPLLNGPEARLCLVHARDVAEAVVAAIDASAKPGIYEVTDARHEGYGWEEIVRTGAAALGRRSRSLALPGGIVRVSGRVADLLGRLPGGAALAHRAGLAGSDKVRELRHPDWSSAPDRQLPAKLWRPRIPLDEGFAETVAAYRRAGWLR